MPGAKLLPSHRRLHHPRQRMSYISGGNTMLREEGLFKGEDTEKARDIRTQRLHPPRPPGPRLRSDQIHHRHTLPFQKPQQPEMKIRRVGQHRDVRFLRRDGLFQLPKFLINPRNMRHHLDDADHRDRPRIHHRPHAACIRGAAHPKNSTPGMAATTREAYKSPEASPAEINMRTEFWLLATGCWLLVIPPRSSATPPANTLPELPAKSANIPRGPRKPPAPPACSAELASSRTTPPTESSSDTSPAQS